MKWVVPNQGGAFLQVETQEERAELARVLEAATGLSPQLARFGQLLASELALEGTLAALRRKGGDR